MTCYFMKVNFYEDKAKFLKDFRCYAIAIFQRVHVIQEHLPRKAQAYLRSWIM